jgi:hypothetical protein
MFNRRLKKRIKELEEHQKENQEAYYAAEQAHIDTYRKMKEFILTIYPKEFSNCLTSISYLQYQPYDNVIADVRDFFTRWKDITEERRKHTALRQEIREILAEERRKDLTN